MATIYQVSQRAGVSLATVSRVINNNAKVKQATREKVLKAMDELNYRPNHTAQSLASNRSNCVGLMVAELGGPFFGDMMAGVEETLRSANKHVIITTAHSDPALEKEGINFLQNRSCDAIIAHCEGLTDDQIIELSEQSKVPLFLMGRQIPKLQNRCVSLDNEFGGYLATKTLIEAGHRQIGYISGPMFKEDAVERLKGHQRALEEFGLPFDVNDVFTGDFHESGGQDGFLSLTSKGQYTAIACGNDEMAAGVIKAAHDQNYLLPEQLSVIGFDDVVFATYLWPALTTVSSSTFQIGKAAANMIIETIYKQSSKQSGIIFEPKLIKRNSIYKINAK
ncbi:LacI family DNA-binding transcriptional regulator [Paraferrimonas sp. SM1919]|uniref:LacI family DNA-binding transcriptional regulator n=1 Tax=Paraferrimonas sp. SM1919 TaxID=2662263 RepID=UPI0013D09D65|nr:LacI family DNA-binding transcriptional regulator [Paraferrimonas sp. SM1919]